MEEKKKTSAKKATTKKTVAKKTTKKPTVKKEVVKKPKKVEEISNEVVDIEDNEPIGPQPTVPSIKRDNAGNVEIKSFEMPSVEQEPSESVPSYNNENDDVYRATRNEEVTEYSVPTYEEPQETSIPTYTAPVQEEVSKPQIESEQETPTYDIPVYTVPQTEAYTATRNEEVTEYSVPTYEEPSVEVESTPIPTYEAPVVEEPVVNEPVVGEPQQEIPTYDIPVYSEPVTTYEEPQIAEIPNMSIEEEQKLPSMDSQIIQEKTTVKVKNKKKKDIRTILLVVLFLGLFLFVMFMPNIQDMIRKIKKDVGMSEIERKAKQIEESQQENSKKKTQTDDGTVVSEKLSVLTCTTNTMALENYDKVVEEVFEYNTKKEVINSKYKTTYRFRNQNEKYEALKNECNENSLKYVDKAGYEVACSYNDNEVVIGDVFDLEVYKTIQEGSKIIEANAKYKEKIDSIKTRLESIGYVCK